MKTRQEGVTLVVALIMLVLLTLLVISGFNMGKGSFQAVANMQQRNAVQSAAQDVLEQTISNTRFMDSPDVIFVNPCGGIQNKQCVDTNGDGDPEVTVSVVSKCVKAKPIKGDKISITTKGESSCALGTNPDAFSLERIDNNSACAETTWEIQATAADAVTDSTVQITQGIRVSTSADNVATSCP